MVSDDSPRPLPNCIRKKLMVAKQIFTMSVRYLERQVEKGIVCHHSHATKTQSISPSLSPRSLFDFSGSIGNISISFFTLAK